MTKHVLSVVLLFMAVQTATCQAPSPPRAQFIAGVNAVPTTSVRGPAIGRTRRPPPRYPTTGGASSPSHDLSGTIDTHFIDIYKTVREGHNKQSSGGVVLDEGRPIIPNAVFDDTRLLPNTGDGAVTGDQARPSPKPEKPAQDAREPDVGAGIVPEGKPDVGAGIVPEGKPDVRAGIVHDGEESTMAPIEGSTPATNNTNEHGDSHNGHGHNASNGGTPNDGHDNGYDHSHEHLDRKPNSVPLHQDIGANIVPLDESMMMDHTHSDGSWHMHGGSSTDGGLSRTDKSLGSEVVDLCDLCLCDNRHTHVSCNSGHTDTSNLTLKAKLIPATAVTLHLKNFDRVMVMAETFASDASLLQHIIFQNIRTLQLQEHSLHFSPHSKENMVVEVLLQNVGVPVLPSSTLTQLDTNTRRSSEHSELALEKTRFITLKLYQCRIGEIESHALYRARLLYFNLTDVTIGSMATKSFDLDVYEEWVVQDSQLPHLPTNAVCLHAEKSVVFSRNMIRELDPYAWAIEAGGQVLFEYNTVTKVRGKAFQNIMPMKASRSANIVFLNNTVISADEDALVTNDLYPRHERKVENNRFNLLCECNISIHFKEMMNIHENESYDVLLTHEVVLRNSLCMPHLGSSQYQYISKFLDQECEPVPVLVIAIAVAVAALLVASVTVAVVCARRAKKALEEVSYLGETSSRSFSTINTNAGPQSPTGCDHLAKNVFYDSQGNPQWIMAVPEVKTYQETEVHVTYEESQPIHSARNSCQDYMIEMQRKTHIRQSCPFN